MTAGHTLRLALDLVAGCWADASSCRRTVDAFREMATRPLSREEEASFVPLLGFFIVLERTYSEAAHHQWAASLPERAAYLRRTVAALEAAVIELDAEARADEALAVEARADFAEGRRRFEQLLREIDATRTSST